ncbi:MAG: GNAT family N-acetyltransferase [Akkermansiaceae bacterium]
MAGLKIGRLQERQWDEVSSLIFTSLDRYFTEKLNHPPMQGGPANLRFFPEIYEELDPGCCVTALCEDSGRLAGACFHHPRDTHFGLGIMAVHPDFGGRGVARTILAEIIALATKENLPIRLVSSAMNLESFSLYTKAGFIPQESFQDIQIAVPKEGLAISPPPGCERVRPATPDDIAAMVALEKGLVGISRVKDYAFFLENEGAIWHSLVAESADGKLMGFLCSIDHPDMSMIGPGVCRNEETLLALLHSELSTRSGQSPIVLIPTKAAEVVKALYQWGGRNTEIHFSQVLGETQAPTGLIVPTFMPESG